MSVPAPTHDPNQRDPDQVSPAETYHRGDPIWVFRQGAWHPGMVDSASALAVMVTYQRADLRGTVVDTVPAEYLVHRHSSDAAGGDR